MPYCALHNRLLEKYGLTVDWDVEIDLFDFDEDYEQIPFSIRRLNNPSNRRNYDSSTTGPAKINEADCDE